MNLARKTGGKFFKFGVFWDVGDCEIPNGCDPRMLYERIENHLKGLGYRGDISFWAYKDPNVIVSDELMRRFKDAGIMFKPNGDKLVRVKNMLVDILLLANEGRGVNFLVLSKNYSTDILLTSVIQALRSRKFLALRGDIELNHPVLHSVVTWVCNWSLTIDQCSERIVNTSVVWGNLSVTGSGIFWDVMDYPIPTDLDAESVYLTIGTALCDKGHFGDVSIWAYGQMQMFPEDSDPDSRFRIGFVPDGGDYPRGFKMLLDMLFWALDNPNEHDDELPTLLILSKDISEEIDFARVVQALENRYYDVFVSEPDKVPKGVLLSSDSSIWLLTCLLDKGKLIDQSSQGDQEGTKTTVSADDQEGTNTTVSGRIRCRVDTDQGDQEGTNTTVSDDDQEGTKITVSGRMRFGGY